VKKSHRYLQNAVTNLWRCNTVSRTVLFKKDFKKEGKTLNITKDLIIQQLQEQIQM